MTGSEKCLGSAGSVAGRRMPLLRSMYADEKRLELFDTKGHRYVAPVEWESYAASSRGGYVGLVALALSEYAERHFNG